MLSNAEAPTSIRTQKSQINTAYTDAPLEYNQHQPLFDDILRTELSEPKLGELGESLPELDLKGDIDSFLQSLDKTADTTQKKQTDKHTLEKTTLRRQIACGQSNNNLPKAPGLKDAANRLIPEIGPESVNKLPTLGVDPLGSDDDESHI